MICSALDVIIQTQRLRDGSRRVTHITEVLGMEGEVPITQDILVYDILGEDHAGMLSGRHRGTGLGRPHFWHRAQYFGEEERLAAALDAVDAPEQNESLSARYN
jgi:pilus assembly protein CpaF